MRGDSQQWSDWHSFPDPRKGDYLLAPIGAGVYWLRDSATQECVYIGESKNVAGRMASLLPPPFGSGTRNNSDLRRYLLENLVNIEYRTLACSDKEEAGSLERELRRVNSPRY